MPCSRINKTNKLVALGEIDEELTHSFMVQTLAILEDHKSVQILLATQGGDLGYGALIMDSIYGKPVDIICSGYIYSAGIFILQGARNRISYKHTSFMLHECKISSDDDKITDLAAYVKHSQSLSDMLMEHMQKRSNDNQEIKSILDLSLTRDIFLTADEAKGFGLIDKII